MSPPKARLEAVPAPESEPIDLLSYAGPSVLKRAIPVLVLVLAVLAVLVVAVLRGNLPRSIITHCDHLRGACAVSCLGRRLDGVVRVRHGSARSRARTGAVGTGKFSPGRTAVDHRGGRRGRPDPSGADRAGAGGRRRPAELRAAAGRDPAGDLPGGPRDLPPRGPVGRPGRSVLRIPAVLTSRDTPPRPDWTTCRVPPIRRGRPAAPPRAGWPAAGARRLVVEARRRADRSAPWTSLRDGLPHPSWVSAAARNGKTRMRWWGRPVSG